VAGDVFDANLLGRRTVLRAVEAMAAVPVPVYLLPGNHDPLDPSTIYDDADITTQLPPHVRVLRDSAPVIVRPGLEVVGAPWRTKRPMEDLVSAALRDLPADGTVRVVVGHGAVDEVMGIVRDEPSTIRLRAVEEAIADGRVHYVALGDRHSTTQVGGTGRVWYSGTPEQTGFDETDPGNVLVVELDDGIRVEPVRVGRWRFVELAHALNGTDDVDALARQLQDMADKTTTLVRLVLTGTISLGAHARLTEVLEAQGAVFAGLEVDGDSDLAVRPDAFDFGTLKLAGFARSALDELTGTAAGTDAQAQAARDALSLLYRLAGGARA